MEIKCANSEDKELWNRIVQNSPHGTIFHTWEWLHCIEAHTGSRFYPVIVFNGTEPVAVYPLYITHFGPVTMAFSPPPRCLLLYLGPVICGWETLKQEKRESIYIKIQEEIDKFIFSDLGCSYARVSTAPGIYDSRPLKWRGYSVEPLYTYRLDTRRGIDVIQEGFDRKVRANVRKAQKEGLRIEDGTEQDIPFILESLKKRYEQQGFTVSDYESYVRNLYATFSPDRIQIYIATQNGVKLSGMITVTYNNVNYMWLGVPKPSGTNLSPNDLIQWEAICRTVLNGTGYYEELESGDDPRTVRFKSKFNPETVVWFSATKYSGTVYRIADTLRQAFRA
jgi:lipid II:glycine glycyltransferase (peptidoglycan interpeptide bridge formation enzyme)